MFKSCNYCRHRKKKCALNSPWDSRCTECDHLDLVCEFSWRQPSLKRRRNSRRIASRVSAAAAAAAAPNHANDRTGSIVSIVKDGDTQLNSPGAGGSTDTRQKIILKDDTPHTPDSTAGKYWAYVHPLTPFVPVDMIHDENEGWDPVLRQCVELAASIWLHYRPDPDMPRRACRSLVLATQGKMTLPYLAGVLLMMLRFPFESDFIQRVSSCSSNLLVVCHT